MATQPTATAWDQPLLKTMLGLYVRAGVDPETPLSEINTMVGTRFIKEGAQRGALVHPGDLIFTRVEDKKTFLLTVECQWRPKTHTVEMRGGYADGKVLDVPDVQKPIHVAILSGGGWLAALDDPEKAASAVETTNLVYQLGGWHALHRYWRFTPAP